MLRYLPLLLIVLVACGKEAVETSSDVATYNIDPGRISVSGWRCTGRRRTVLLRDG